MEADEDPASAAVRETAEETGLQVEILNLRDVCFFDDDPRGNGVLVVYSCAVLGGVLSPSPEGILPTFFHPADIPGAVAGGGHDRVIRAWQRQLGHCSLRG